MTIPTSGPAATTIIAPKPTPASAPPPAAKPATHSAPPRPVTSTAPAPATANLPDWLTQPGEDDIAPGVKGLFLGDSGSGKTHLMHTLIEAGLEVFHIGLEPARQTIAKAIRDTAKKNPSLDYSKYHYVEVPALVTEFKTMIDTDSKLNSLSYKAICDMEGINRDKTRQFIRLLEMLSGFTEGETYYGPIDNWSNDKALVIDSLSAMNIMAKTLIAGNNPALSPAQWNMGQDVIRNLLNKLCFDCKCHVFVLGHLEPEKDEVSGKIVNMPSTLGKKLAPELGRYFDEMVIVKKTENGHVLSTKESNATTKNRLFPVSNTLPPTLVPLIEEWRTVNKVPK